MGYSHVLCLCLQGGGVYVASGTVTFSSCIITGNTAYWVRTHAQNFPSPQWDFHMVCTLCLQGGGVYIYDGTVTFSSCTITGNTATGVRAQLQISHRPDGSFTCFALVLAGRRCLCSVWRGSTGWHVDLVIVHHHWKLGTCRRDLQLSHRPHWETHVCSLFAGWWCLN